MSHLSRRHLLAAGLGLGSLAALAGCAPGGATADGPAAIRFAWWGNASRHEATRQMIAAFTAAHPDVTVGGEPGDFGGYFDRLATQTAARDAPDVITLGGAYVAEYAQRGALLDLAEVSDSLSLAGMDPSAVTNGQVEGVQYAVTTGVNAQSVIVNPAVFEAAGVELPDDETWTWDDFARIATEISAATPEGTYGSATVMTHDSLDAFARQRGEALYTPDGVLGLTVGTVADFFGLTASMLQSKATAPAAELTEKSDLPAEQSLMGTGTAAMQVTWSNALTSLSDAAQQPMQLMLVPGESPRPGLWLQSSQFYAVYAGSEHPEQAAALIDFLVNDPGAGAIVKTDRGVPAVGAVRTAITDALSPTAGAEADYIERLSGRELQQTVIGPAGSTAIADITERMSTEVLFGRATPQQAAERWVSESEQAIR